MRRVELRIRGRVQGVYYRASTQAQAQRLGLTGWVRNERDGSVHALAEGPEPALQELVQWCADGPPAARVEDVETTWTEARGEFDSFGVRY